MPWKTELEEEFMKKLTITIFIFASLALSSVFAADKAQTEQADAKKKELFRVYMEQIGGLAEYNKILGLVKQQTQQVLQHVLQEKNNKDVTVTQEQLDQAVANSIAGIDKWLAKEMQQGEIIDNVFFPVHGSAFSEQDLRVILEFLNSDAGKKYTQQKNLLMRQSFQILSEMYIPRMQEELVKIVEKEAENILLNEADLKKVKK